MAALHLLKLGFKTLSAVAPRAAARTSMELLFWPRNPKRTPAEAVFWNTGTPITFSSGCKGRVFTAGNADSTGNVWLVHGWQSKGSRFKALIDHLILRGYRVIVWEGPGHGDSPGYRTHLAEFSRYLHQDIMTSEFSPRALVGHSFGGASAAYVCKLGIPAETLVLVAAPSSASGVFERYWDFIELGARSRKHFIRMAEDESRLAIDELSSETFVKDLSQKILVVHDQCDRLVPFSDAERLKAQCQRINFMKTEALGHHRIAEAPEVVARIGEFIEA